MTEGTPCVIMSNVKKTDTEEIVKKLEELGCSINYK